MRKLFLIIMAFVCMPVTFSQQKESMVLWYNQPAKTWNKALPIGNVQLGAMVFGNTAEELIQLNEETLWTGGSINPNPNPEAPQYLPEVRKRPRTSNKINA